MKRKQTIKQENTLKVFLKKANNLYASQDTKVTFCDISIICLLIGSFIQMYAFFGYGFSGLFKSLGFEALIIIFIHGQSRAKKNNIGSIMLPVYLFMAILVVSFLNFFYEVQEILGSQKITIKSLKQFDWFQLTSFFIGSGVLPLMILGVSKARQIHVLSKQIEETKDLDIEERKIKLKQKRRRI